MILRILFLAWIAYTYIRYLTSVDDSLYCALEDIKLVVYKEIIVKKNNKRREKKVECLLPNPTNRKSE